MTIFVPKELEQVQYIDPSDLKQWITQEGKPLLIDVREEDKHLAYNIGGVNISIYDFMSSINELDPEQPTVIYCQVGQKSFNAAVALIQADFNCVYSLKGGIEAWNKFVTTSP